MEERDRFLPFFSEGPPLLLSEGERAADPETAAFAFRETLFCKAFLVVPGPQYNRVSYEMRGQGTAKRLTFYEVILAQEIEWGTLRDRTYPPLARYLKAKSINPLAPAGVVVSLFFEDYFYLIEASEFMRAYREMEGIDATAFQQRVKRWLAG